MYQPKNPKYPYAIKFEVKWPFKLIHEGKEYYHTGKVGANIATGCPSAEYHEYHDDSRVWLNLEGEVQNE